MSQYIRQTDVINADTGEVVHHVTTIGSQLGKGWVVMYKDRTTEFICSCPSASTIKVFFLLAMGQKFDNHGMITTKKAVQEKLGITKQTCLEAFKYLKEKFIINECKVDGVTEYMVNPALVTVGRDKKAREKEWVRRWSGQVIKTIPDPTKKKKSKRAIE